MSRPDEGREGAAAPAGAHPSATTAAQTLGQTAISGFVWGSVDALAAQGIQFATGLVLARLLTPREFGLLGLTTVFLLLSQTFVDSGFGNALIRKPRCSAADYSTVFYFNTASGVVFAALLTVLAGGISRFFGEPELEPLLQVLCWGVVISALGVIHRTILTKEMDFRTQTKVSLAASGTSGVVAIAMAINGFGVWSLVGLTLSKHAVTTALFWVCSRWRPTWAFSLASFRELFGFGSKLLVSGLLNTAFENLYFVVIGKFWSTAALGQFTRADQFKALPSLTLTTVVTRVSYPLLCQLQEQPDALKDAYRRLIRHTVFIAALMMLVLGAAAEGIILTLIGDQWLAAVRYLQLMVFLGVMHPLHALNLNMLQVQGRSDLFLKLEVIKKVLAVPTVVVGVLLGIEAMICGMLVNSVLAYYVNSYWSGRVVGYSAREQVKDVLPSLGFGVVVASAVWLVGVVASADGFLGLGMQLAAAVLVTVVIGELTRYRDYLSIRGLLQRGAGVLWKASCGALLANAGERGAK